MNELHTIPSLDDEALAEWAAERGYTDPTTLCDALHWMVLSIRAQIALLASASEAQRYIERLILHERLAALVMAKGYIEAREYVDACQEEGAS